MNSRLQQEKQRTSWCVLSRVDAFPKTARHGLHGWTYCSRYEAETIKGRIASDVDKTLGVIIGDSSEGQLKKYGR